MTLMLLAHRAARRRRLRDEARDELLTALCIAVLFTLSVSAGDVVELQRVIEERASAVEQLKRARERLRELTPKEQVS